MCCRQYICFVKWGAALFTYPKNVTPSWGSPLASLTRLIVPVIWVYMWVWGQQLLPFLICLEIQGLCSPGKWWKFLALNLKWSPWCQALRWDCGWGSQGHSVICCQRGNQFLGPPPLYPALHPLDHAASPASETHSGHFNFRVWFYVYFSAICCNILGEECLNFLPSKSFSSLLISDSETVGPGKLTTW